MCGTNKDVDQCRQIKGMTVAQAERWRLPKALKL
jgi:hypothetical protein